MGSGGSYLLDGSASFAVMQGTPEITYKYDALGRLIKVTDSMNGDRDYDFDPAGNRKEVGNN
ncbi:hypothetical protein CXF79_06050 [Colwellia sp. Bg11-28]|nr:hypothetical protein CXF79_06050 [Colwellia sp. Bg11-28]